MAEVTLTIAPHERQAFADLHEAFQRGEQLHAGNVHTLLLATEVYEALQAITVPIGRNGQKGIPPSGGEVRLTQAQAEYLREWADRGVNQQRFCPAPRALGVLVLLQRTLPPPAEEPQAPPEPLPEEVGDYGAP